MKVEKCKICNSRKGKRICILDQKWICTECCGTSRTEQLCAGCSYYSPPARRYQDVPRFALAEMESSDDLQSVSNAIEGEICLFDANNGKILNDLICIKIIESLLDKYYFKTESQNLADEFLASGFLLVDNVIENDLKKTDNLTLTKVLALIWFVAKRRTTGRREYLTVIHNYVGIRIAKGVRLME